MNGFSAEAPPTLLFNWESQRQRRLAIVGFLAASALLHAFCFYLFQIVYPPAVVLAPAPARVHLIAPNSEEGRTLLRWIDAEDPALASATIRPSEARLLRALPKPQHIPSYLTHEPKLKPIPPLTLDTRAPSSQPPGPVPTPHRQVERAIGPVPTRVLFSEELTRLGAAKFAPTNFTISTNEAPESVRFRIAVNSRGEIRYCFPLNSSGDAALDKQARHYVVTGRFPSESTTEERENQSLLWGVATIEWGNDVAHSQVPPAIPAP